MKAFAAMLVILAAGCGGAAPLLKDRSVVDVTLETSIGNIRITVDAAKAPISARAFLSLVDDGRFSGHSTFYRAVRKENDHGHPTITVIEGGIEDSSKLLPGIGHESTQQTGLRHRDGTVSLGRGAVGTATGAEFFICIGDQPGLDAGGGRNKDGKGFAAFGQVTEGMDVVRKIHQLPTRSSASDPYLSGQMLDAPVQILRAFRKVQ